MLSPRKLAAVRLFGKSARIPWFEPGSAPPSRAMCPRIECGSGASALSRGAPRARRHVCSLSMWQPVSWRFPHAQQ